MKLNENNVEVLSNVKAQKTAFSISDNAQDTALAIDVITNKGYKHKIQTPVQEYICNARDSHREAGQTRRIEITLPTVFDPVFKVRDFGVGICSSKMADVFVKFFASTKRRDNSQTGGFGLGAKSAWAYTDSFGIISITDGVKRTYTAYKAGQGMLQPEGEEQTTEPTGVEISIAVNPKDIADFKNAVIRTVFFWNEAERPVIVNDPTPIAYPSAPRQFGRMSFYEEKELYPLTHNRGYNGGSRYYGSSQDMVVLDGVPYDLDEDVVEKLGTKLRERYQRKVGTFFLVLNTGEVSITPFRESLEYNEFTMNALKGFIDDSVKILEKDFNSKISKAKTVKEKAEIIKFFAGAWDIDQLKLNDIVNYRNGNLDITLEPDAWKKFTCAFYDGDKIQNFYRKNSWNRTLHVEVNTVIVEFDSSKDKDSERKARMKFTQYAKEQGAKRGSSRSRQTILFMSFTPETQDIRTKLAEVFDLVCSSTLKYQKPVSSEVKAAPTKRTGFEVTELSNKGYSKTIPFDDEVLERTFYIYASEYVSNKYEMERMGRFLRKSGYTLLSISKGDEKHVLKKQALKLQDNLDTIELSEEDCLGFFANLNNQNDSYLLEMESAFTNKTMLDYIGQFKAIKALEKKWDKKRDEDNDYNNNFRCYGIEIMRPVLEANKTYKKLLTTASKGSKLLKDEFSLLEIISHRMNKEILTEITAYVKTKEKGV